MSDSRTIEYSGPLKGTIQIPGDKSISHRAAMLLAVSEGDGRIENFAGGDDCASTIACLQQLGIRIERDGSTVRIAGAGLNGFKVAAEPLDCGNSGTTMRLLAGLLAGSGFVSVLTGDDSLRSRPMARIVEPLGRMGAEIETADGKAPLTINGTHMLSAIDYELPVASAQVESCILFAGLNADGPVTVSGPESPLKRSLSRDHTARMLRFLDVDIEEDYRESGGLFRHVSRLNPSSTPIARDLFVPGDVSTAAFFLVAAAGLKGSDITLSGIGLNESRSGIIDVMKDCGIRIGVDNVRQVCNEPIGDVFVNWDGECELVHEPLVVSGDKTSGLIDEIPVLAVLGTLLPGGLEIRDASELRIKESDRISAVVENLRRMQAGVEEFDDGFRVIKSRLRGARVESYGDHRIAMAFAVAGMFAEGKTIIENADCVSVSCPGFFETLDNTTCL